MRIFRILHWIPPVILATTLSPWLCAQSADREIVGQVRLGTQAAPAGLPVTLQVVGGKYIAASSEPVVARVVTDGRGRFSFEHLEKVGGREGREFFAVSVRAPGYSPVFQVVDLTMVARDQLTLDLQKLDSRQTNPSNSDSAGSAASPVDTAPRRSTNAQAQKHLDLAQELLFRKGDPQNAIQELKQAIHADPWYAPGYLLLGLANMQLERWSEAQQAFSEATKVEPGNVQAYLGLGSALNEQRDYPAAQKNLEYALQLKPDSAEAHYELARTFSSLQKWDAAEPHARRALELNPGYSGPHILMANIYLEQHDLDSARREFKEYLRLDPEGNLAAAARQALADIDKALAAGKPR